MDALVEMLRSFGVKVDGKKLTRRERIQPEALSLMMDDRHVVHVRQEKIVFHAPSEDPGMDDEIVYERVVLERYRLEGVDP